MFLVTASLFIGLGSLYVEGGFGGLGTLGEVSKACLHLSKRNASIVLLNLIQHWNLGAAAAKLQCSL